MSKQKKSPEALTGVINNTCWETVAFLKSELIKVTENENSPHNFDELLYWIDDIQDAVVEDMLAPEHEVFPLPPLAGETKSLYYRVSGDEDFDTFLVVESPKAEKVDFPRAWARAFERVKDCEDSWDRNMVINQLRRWGWHVRVLEVCYLND